MKARQPDAVAALRTAIAAIDNAEAVPAPEARQAATSSHIAGASAGLGAAEAARRALSDSEQRAILRDQVTGYTAEAGRYEALGRPAAAARLQAQARLLSGYLREALVEHATKQLSRLPLPPRRHGPRRPPSAHGSWQEIPVSADPAIGASRSWKLYISWRLFTRMRQCR
jgi:hypothetical protein